jgi:hypothetical protein
MFLEKKKIESQIIWLLVVLYSVEGNWTTTTLANW